MPRVMPRVVEFDFTFRGQKMRVTEGRYHTTKAPSLTIYGKHGDPYATLTANLPGSPNPEPGCYYIKTWSENREIAAAVLMTGRFEDTGERIPSGFVEVRVWRYLG